MAKLSAKMNAVANHLGKNNKLNDQELKPIRHIAQTDSFLGTTLSTLHQYIHNQHFFPSPGDLLSGWDNLEKFFVVIWE